MNFGWLFVPSVTLMDRLSYTQKFSLIRTVFFLSTLVLSVLQVLQVFVKTEQTRLQQQGLTLLGKTLQAYFGPAYYRDLDTRYAISRDKELLALLAKQKAAKIQDSTIEIEQMIGNRQEGVQQAISFTQHSRDMADSTQQASQQMSSSTYELNRIIKAFRV